MTTTTTVAANGYTPTRTAAPTRDVLRERIERQLGAQYEVERELGGGGMSRVYAARELATGRRVALKALPPELTDDVSAERFRREVRVVSALAHPSIVPLIGSGEGPGLLYYVMPLVEGESLRARLEREGTLPAATALAVAADIASALDHAHRRGVVHRDVKPENILLANNRALVADFGIARAVGRMKRGLTGNGMSIGTPAYMSPEQASAERDLDGRSDVYSLGCVLYEALCGEPPFTGPTPHIVIARRFAVPAAPLPSARDADPARLDPVVLRALAREPADRYESAGAFATALHTLRASLERGGSPNVVVPAARPARAGGFAAAATSAIDAIAGLVRRRRAL